MKLLILTFRTEKHGEVEVYIRNPQGDMTPSRAKAIAEGLIPTYRTPRHHIPLKEFCRAKLVVCERKVL